MPQTIRRIGCALLINRAGDFLLQQRDDIPGIIQPGKIGLFGGHCEGSETGFDCAVREVSEETSVDIARERFEALRTFEGSDPELPGGHLEAAMFVVRDVDETVMRITEGTLYVLRPAAMAQMRGKLTPIADMAFAALNGRA